MRTAIWIAALLIATPLCAADTPSPLCISGRYPHLAMFNRQGECGTGAVVPWAGRLWVITYAPHQPSGSDDKLYEIDDSLHRVTRPESVGGTPAGRLLHRESGQLLIGPYVIDGQRNVRVISPRVMPGRLTAIARHLADPANLVYYVDMEGMVYEVNVRTLAVRKLFDKPVPGWHGKGACTAQGRLVIANNGEMKATGHSYASLLVGGAPRSEDEAGVLAEWDGRTWRIVERRQYTEVTGPGGIEGPPSPDAPLWAVGWDKRSVLLKLLDGGRWHTYRLPKADYSFDGKHGWHTEWPRIREVAPGKLLMNMHGAWFDFPKTFSAARTGGLRPIASHLKITADFCDWNGRIVFGCDDMALSDFGSGNALKAGNQSQSGPWFTRWDALPQCGRPAGFGGPWVHDAVKAGQPSVPFLLAGYAQRVLHLAHAGQQPLGLTIEIDANGNGQWKKHQSIRLPARGFAWHIFPSGLAAQWVRLTPDRDNADTTAYFHFGPGGPAVTDRNLFASLADAGASGPWAAGVIRARGNDTGTLLYEARVIDAAGQAAAPTVLEIRRDLKFRPAADVAAEEWKDGSANANLRVQCDAASVIVTQGSSRYRLPKGDPAYDAPGAVPPRIREVVTERSLLNAHGSLYLLPRQNSGGVARIKPVCTHNKRIADYCSWRGMLVLAGNRTSATPDGHYFAADDASVGLWFGDVDDLWKLGKPRGQGGPWLNTPVTARTPSDPYLMTGYDRKSVELSHQAAEPVTLTLEVDFDGTGWHKYQAFRVEPGQIVQHVFPEGFSAHWVRAVSDRDGMATVRLVYE